MAVSLTTEMGISDVVSLVVVVVINVVACPLSALFGKLMEYVGSEKMIYVGTTGYVGVILTGSLTKTYPSFTRVVALLAGMFQGSIQSVSRSYFARPTPDEADSNKFFGFFSIFSKFSAILEPMAVFTIIMITRGTQYGISNLIPMMLPGVLFLAFIKDPEGERKFYKKK